MPSLDDYLGKIPAYNAIQPDFMATLTAVLQPLVDLQELLDGMPEAFDLDTAIGVQLDQVGEWIGRSRLIDAPISDVYFSWDVEGLGWEEGYWQGAFDPDNGITALDDETYRALLYAKAAANHWDGSTPSAANSLNILLASRNLSARVIDNQDMSMSVVVVGTVDDLVFKSIILRNYIPIKPAGVRISYSIVPPLPVPGASLQIDPASSDLLLAADGSGDIIAID